MNMPLDKFGLCTKSITKRAINDRAIMVMDTAGAIAGIFGKKDSLTEYLNSLKVELDGN